MIGGIGCVLSSTYSQSFQEGKIHSGFYSLNFLDKTDNSKWGRFLVRKNYSDGGIVTTTS